MLKAKPFLAIDFGAGTLKLAEFEINEAGALTLRQFGRQPLGLEGSQESARERVVAKALQDLLAARGFTARQANVCAPGFQVFSKFVKLPPVDTAKVTQIIQYEAQQNVPFPLTDVVWDYQILGTAPGGELDVLLVAIKTDLVEGLFRIAEGRGLRLNVVDASPAALCNAFKFNYGELEGCSMLLDIGAKTSNVLFFEKGKVFARGISIGANTITQDFATETKQRFAEAEAFKIEHGFVSLGGAYEEPDDPKQAAVAKVARQVMTRLHIQLNQTIQFYRGQQGGGAPQRLFLSGGASIMPYASQFFGEKLNIPVEYFNPLRNIQLGPDVNVDELTPVAHAFGEVVGVALRNLAQCPVELNLMPKSSRQRQQFEQKKPYLLAAMFSLVGVVAAFGWFNQRLANDKEAALVELTDKVSPLSQRAQDLDEATGRLKTVEGQVREFEGWLDGRFFTLDLLTELRRVFAAAEAKASANGPDTGVWIESLKMGEVSAGAAAAEPEPEAEAAPRPTMSLELMKRYGLLQQQSAGGGAYADTLGGGETADAGSTPASKSRPKSTNEISEISLVCRAINRNRLSPTNHLHLANVLEQELRASPMFQPEGTQLGRLPNPEDSAPTFSFEVTVSLKNPVKL
ncbi:MAG: pilus assembly protein PilM [Limisphaerales bacterium]